MRGIIPIVLTSAAAIALASAAFSEERSYVFDDFQRIDAAMGVEVKVTTGTGYAVEAARAAGYLVRSDQPSSGGPLDELFASAGVSDPPPAQANNSSSGPPEEG